VAGKADVASHLAERRDILSRFFSSWGAPTLDESERRSLLADYFIAAKLGNTNRVGSSESLFVAPRRANSNRPTILVIGRHDSLDLASAPPAAVADSGIVGPGVASRVGPTIAFAEGVRAANTLTEDDPVNVRYLSLGAGEQLSALPPSLWEDIDVAYLTNAVVWSPHHPTLTTGSRGRLVAEVSLAANESINDYVAAGAVRNPLTTLTKILGELRDGKGRIAIDGFYDRALKPDSAARSSFTRDEHDADAWVQHVSIPRPAGSISALERATVWPGVSVLSVSSDPTDGQTASATAKATIALYLVADQRHIEIEQAFRTWFADRAPADLRPTVHVIESSRPYRCAPDNRAVEAQTRAAYRLFNRQPILVPGGGPPGAGEAAFLLSAPVGFAGVSSPTATYGSLAESLPWTHFDAGAALAAETCLQLRRRA